MEHGDRPVIMLKVERVLCAMHGSPFYQKWPAGYPTFVMQGFQAVTETEGFWEEQDKQEDNPTYIGRMLDALPICCRIGPAKILEIMRAANDPLPKTEKIWPPGICKWCQNVAMEICHPLTQGYEGELYDKGPCCLECWLFRFQCRSGGDG